MKSFRHYLFEAEGGQAQVQVVQAKAQELSRPANVQKAITALGVANVDQLIQKLESDPKVKQVLQQYRQVKATAPQTESIIGSVLGGVASAAKGVGKWLLNSVGSTIGRVLGGMFAKDTSSIAKLNYAAMLLLTFGLSPYLLAVGAPMAAVTGAMPYTATWWGLTWFGHTFIEPAVAAADGIHR